MRWPFITSFITLLFAFTLLDSIAAAPVKDKDAVNAGAFKKGSKTYRNAAMKNPTSYQKTTLGGQVVKMKTTKAASVGRDADHKLEAQTVATAVKKAGINKKSAIKPAAMKEIKNILNAPANMAFVDADVNKAKGQAQRSALKGKSPAVDAPVKHYMKQVDADAKATAKQLDAAFKKHGYPAVKVEDEQERVMKKLKLRRRLLELLDGY